MPIGVRVGVPRGIRARRALLRTIEMAVAVDQVVDQTAMPGRSGVDAHPEAEAPVGISGKLVLVLHADVDRAQKILVAVCGTQLLMRIGPLGVDAATPDDASRLHLEHVGEIAAESDLQIEADVLAAMVGDVEVFVHAAGKPAGQREAKSVCGHRCRPRSGSRGSSSR